MPGVHRRRLAATRQAMLLSTWEQLCGHSTSIQESRLTSRTDGCQPLPSGAMTSAKLQGRRPVEMDPTCRAETQRNAALTLIGRFLEKRFPIWGCAQGWFSSQSLDVDILTDSQQYGHTAAVQAAVRAAVRAD